MFFSANYSILQGPAIPTLYIVQNVFLPHNKEVEKTDRNSVKSFSALQKKVAIDSAARRQMLPTF